MNFYEQLLRYFRLTEADYSALTAPVTTLDLPEPTKFRGIESVVLRIQKAIANKEKIVIYGDYDCDGILATSILVKTFKMLNYPVGYYVPSRYQDGYGLTADKVELFASKNYQLIITVDNGVSQIDAGEKAQAVGIDLIITDHHEILANLPAFYGLLHPTYSYYGDVVTCGAYVAFMLASALLNRYDPYLLSLTAIATMADMMQVKSYNRTIIRLGVELMNKHQFPSIVKLADSKLFDEQIIAMNIAPKVNAIGRMIEDSKINYLVQYFTTDSLSEMDVFYAWIENVNDDRKKTMKAAFLGEEEVENDKAAIVTITLEKEGLIGLLAARYLSTYDKPALVFTYDSNDPTLLKGSCRSKKGFNVAKAFQSLSSLLVKHGGHASAGGCTIELANFEIFKAAFITLAEQYQFEQEQLEAINITLDDISWDNYRLLRTFAPFGQGFKPPLFLLSAFPIDQLTFISNNQHLVYQIDRERKIIGFNLDKSQFPAGQFVNLYGELTASVFRGRQQLQFQVVSFSINELDK